MRNVVRYESWHDIKPNDLLENTSFLYLVSNEKFMSFTGKNVDGHFHIKLNTSLHDYWKEATCDFIQYTLKKGQKPIIIGPEPLLLEALTVYDHCFNSNHRLRHYEPSVFIHSTEMASWKKIQQDGYLFSWQYLKNQHKIDEGSPIGHLLGDPEEFSAYIMLGHGLNMGGEYVIQAKQEGRILCEDDRIYQSGVRLYLDGEKLARDGKLVRDGAHYKVFEKIELKKYLLHVVEPSLFEVGATFTPKSYAEQANLHYHNHYKENGLHETQTL